ncbi:MAG: hypothetical protein WA828_14100 [Coleofasciculaceae cyanobacterium]
MLLPSSFGRVGHFFEDCYTKNGVADRKKDKYIPDFLVEIMMLWIKLMAEVGDLLPIIL